MHLRRSLSVAALGALLSATVPLAAPVAAAQHPATQRSASWAVHRVSPHAFGRHRRRTAATQQSLNWSGYVRAGHGDTAATGSWTVPTLSGAHDGYSSTWVGIDGASAGDGYLIQTGTEADVVHGRQTYDAWWEVITPSDVAPETVFSTLRVRPGDAITASVVRTSAGHWTLRLVDTTTGRSASHSTAFAGHGASVEWIQEDTDVDGYISTAPDWGTVTFRGLTLNGAPPRLARSEALDIVDARGTRETSTGAPNSAGSGFSVRWLAAGTRSPAP